MRIIDITRTLQEAPVYPGDAPARLSRGPGVPGGPDAFTVTMGLHSGTHADAFSHFLPDGADIASMPLEHYCGPCRLLRVPENCLVRVDDLRGRIAGAERLALCSGGSAFLCEEAAEYLAACGVRAVVTDAVSIAPPDNEAAVHTILLRAGVAVVENALLEGVPEGDYLLFAFPLKIALSDGAPVRAVLLSPGSGDGGSDF